MAIPLRQSTASQEVSLGPFLDDQDGKTAETGLTIANTDIKLWKMGSTSEVNKNSGGGTHVASGRYSAVLDATDSDTLGGLVLYVHVAGALPVRLECCVFPANVYDSLFAGSDKLEVDVAQFGGAALTASGGIPEVKVNSYASGQTPLQPTTAGRTLDVNAGGEAGIDWGNVGSPGSTVNLSGTTIGTLSGHTPQSGDAFARLGAPAGVSVSADLAAVKNDTGNLVSRITANLFNGITSLAEWLGLLAGKQAGNSTALTEMRATGAGSGTFDPTTDSQEAIRDRGDAGWVTGNTVAPLDAAGTRTALGMSSANLDTQLSGINTNVDAAETAIINALPSEPPTVAEIADGVLDEPLAGHLTDGSVGKALQLARAGGIWRRSVDGNNLLIYDIDDVTLLATLPLAPSGGPYTSIG